MTPELTALSALNCRAGAPLLPVAEVTQRLKALPT